MNARLQMSKLPVKSFARRPFHNSVMGRELCLADISAGNGTELLLGDRALQRRLDRLICKLTDFEMHSIEMVGRDAIPRVSYTKEMTLDGKVQKLKLPVLPSDHFGLLLTISRRD